MTDPTDKWAEFHAKAEEFGSSSDAIEYLIDEIVRLREALRDVHTAATKGTQTWAKRILTVEMLTKKALAASDD
jgi:hypothetical protein